MFLLSLYLSFIYVLSSSLKVKKNEEVGEEEKKEKKEKEKKKKRGKKREKRKKRMYCEVVGPCVLSVRRGVADDGGGGVDHHRLPSLESQLLVEV